MTTFQDNLATLPAIDNIERLELYTTDGVQVGEVANRPGSQGSVRVYLALARNGTIGPAEAAEGLRLYAEHTEDARQRPGAHPNIDRLLQLMASGEVLKVQVVRAS